MRSIPMCGGINSTEAGRNWTWTLYCSRVSNGVDAARAQDDLVSFWATATFDGGMD